MLERCIFELETPRRIVSTRNRDPSSGLRQHGRDSALLADKTLSYDAQQPVGGSTTGGRCCVGLERENIMWGCFRDRSQLAQHPCCKAIYAEQGPPRRESQRETRH